MTLPQAFLPPIETRPRIAIVGGGLAGLAAAVALSQTHASVALFESRTRFGGRATSFREPATGEWVDFCQHVSMQCCTNLADFVRRLGLADFFTPASTLAFIGPDGRRCDLTAAAWLPAPLHLAPGLRKLAYLTPGDRRAIARAMWRLMRTPLADAPDSPTAREWLRAQGQSERAISLFWGVVLVSALGESLERASMAAARKVFVDGFLASNKAYIVQTPQAPLGELFGERAPEWLARRGVALHAGASIKQLGRDAQGRFTLEGPEAARGAYDRLVVAVAWRHLSGLLPEAWRTSLPWLAALERWPAAPITGVHLWFDRPITELARAVLVGRLGQWLFNRCGAAGSTAGEYYYQVVISASRDLGGRNRDELVGELCEELGSIWPAARAARLLRHRVVTEPMAVFSVAPGSERWRPAQRTAIEGLCVAGDWTATGWPATMEGAVRGGYLAAEEVTASWGERRRFLAPDLPRSWLAKLLIR